MNKKVGGTGSTYLGITVLALIFSALAGDVTALVAHVTGTLRLWTITSNMTHLGTVVARGWKIYSLSKNKLKTICTQLYIHK